MTEGELRVSEAAANTNSFDVAMIGGGPAGATAGRRLAEWGYSVLILNRPEDRTPSLAESLPPSIRKLFRSLGIQDAVDKASFYRSSGNMVWWGEPQARAEKFPGPPSAWGYQVQRSEFDRLLLDLAEAAGALVDRGAIVRGVDLEGSDGVRLEYESAGVIAEASARFVLDCSGRAGVIARRAYRRKEPGYSTLALCGVWRRKGGWSLEDESHTLVEAYEDGWAWSIPISPEVRYFTAMVEPRVAPVARGAPLESIYRAELAKTRQFRGILELAGARLESAPWGADASLYSADTFAGPRFLLVGDAASFIEPLSSFGVKKALASAWTAAVVVNTCLQRPGMAAVGLEYFSEREGKMYAGSVRQAAEYFRQAAAAHKHRFWETRAAVRADAPEEDLEDGYWKRDPRVQAVLEKLKKSSELRLESAPDVRREKRPEIVGREVVLEDALVSPSLPGGLRYLEHVNLVRLTDLAPAHQDVASLFEAYNRTSPPVEMPAFLGALSFLLARGILRHAAASSGGVRHSA
jgi:flavin-dependent dehydrogenase